MISSLSLSPNLRVLLVLWVLFRHLQRPDKLIRLVLAEEKKQKRKRKNNMHLYSNSKVCVQSISSQSQQNPPVKQKEMEYDDENWVEKKQ